MLTKTQAINCFEIVGENINRKPSSPGYSERTKQVAKPYFQASKITGEKGYYSWEDLKLILQGKLEQADTVKVKLLEGYRVTDGVGYSPTGAEVKTVKTTVGKLSVSKYLELQPIETFQVKDDQLYYMGRLVEDAVICHDGHYYFTKALLQGKQEPYESKCPASWFHEVAEFFRQYPDCIFVKKVQGYNDLMLTLDQCPDVKLFLGY